MDFEPTVILPAGEFRKVIPRYILNGIIARRAREALSRVEAEVTAITAGWNPFFTTTRRSWSRPPIDVPISQAGEGCSKLA